MDIHCTCTCTHSHTHTSSFFQSTSPLSFSPLFSPSLSLFLSPSLTYSTYSTSLQPTNLSLSHMYMHIPPQHTHTHIHVYSHSTTNNTASYARGHSIPPISPRLNPPSRMTLWPAPPPLPPLQQSHRETQPSRRENRSVPLLVSLNWTTSWPCSTTPSRQFKKVSVMDSTHIYLYMFMYIHVVVV